MISAELLQKILATLPQTAQGSHTAISKEKYVPIDENALKSAPNKSPDTVLNTTPAIQEAGAGIAFLLNDIRGILTFQIDGTTYSLEKDATFQAGEDRTALVRDALNSEAIKNRYASLFSDYNQRNVILRPTEQILKQKLGIEDTALDTPPTTFLTMSSEAKSLSLQTIDGEQYLIAVENNIALEEKTAKGEKLKTVNIEGAEVITVYKVTDGKLEHLGAVTSDPRINIALRDPRGYVAREAETESLDTNSVFAQLLLQGGITQEKFVRMDTDIVSAITAAKAASENDSSRVLSGKFNLDQEHFLIPAAAIKDTGRFDVIINDQNRISQLRIDNQVYKPRDSQKEDSAFKKTLNLSAAENPFAAYFLAFSTYEQNVSRPIEALVADRYTLSVLGGDTHAAPDLKFSSKTALMSYQTIKNKQYCIIVETDFEFAPTLGSVALPIKFDHAEVITIFEITEQGAYLSKGSHTSDLRLKALIKDPIAYVKQVETEVADTRKTLVTALEEGDLLDEKAKQRALDDINHLTQWINNSHKNTVLAQSAKLLSKAIDELSDDKKIFNYKPIRIMQKAMIAVLTITATEENSDKIINQALWDVYSCIDMLNATPKMQKLQSQEETAQMKTILFALSAFAGVLLIAAAAYISVQTLGLGIFIGAPLSQFGLTLLGINITASAAVVVAAGAAMTGAGTYYGFKNYRKSQEIAKNIEQEQTPVAENAPKVVEQAKELAKTIRNS